MRALILTLLSCCLAGSGAELMPLSPAIALSRFQLEPGCQIELIAAEPLVESPCALAWDEAGRMFVAENRGYPTGAPDGSPQGRIARLELSRTGTEVTNEVPGGAGRSPAWTRTEFATRLEFPNGLLPWNGGLLVTDAPHLYWLADTNQDGRADHREIWFTGFATNQTTQLRACYPVLGPDGWIYVARGWSGGVVTSPRWPHLPAVDLKDGDFRFRPDGSAAEAIGGNAQFGLVLDDVGRRFLVSNRNPLMHAVADPRWWKRLPSLPFAEVVEDVAAPGPGAVVHPVSPDLTTAGFMTELMAAPHAGTFTSACGIHQYFGEALPAALQGNWFICEPAQNLIQRQIATPHGPSFRSQPAPKERDFLASSDPWFHPVSIWTGPDGALYVADMYRKFIDHPDYLPASVRPTLDFEAGKHMGRIWRIAAAGEQVVTGSAASAAQDLRRLDDRELVEALHAPNIWTRQTAHRLLLERGDSNVMDRLAENLAPRLRLDPSPSTSREPVPSLTQMAQQRREDEPPAGPHLGQARMLRMLFDRLSARSGSGEAVQLSPEENRPVMQLWLYATLAPAPSVREAAWRAVQPGAGLPKPIADASPDLLRLWIEDPSPAVRFQLAYCLGQSATRRTTEGLVRILRRDAANRWARAVVLSGLRERSAEFLEIFLQGRFQELPGEPSGPAGFADHPGLIELAGELGRIWGAGPGGELLWRSAFPPSAQGSVWPLTLLRGMSQSARQGGETGAAPPLLGMAARYSSTYPSSLSNLIRHVSATIPDLAAPLLWKTNAISFLGELDYERSGATLLGALTPAQPREAQLAAARALAQIDSETAARALVAPGRWEAYPPAVREIVVNGLVSRPRRVPVLLDAVEEGIVPIWAIPAQRRQQLRHHRDAALRERALRLLGAGSDPDRHRILEEYRSVLRDAGDIENGRAVFLRVCATCHQHGRDGAKVGPDLTGVRNQPAEALLLHILVPDAEIYPGYENYECETADGRSLGGLLAAETATSITLRRALGEEDTIPRRQIVSLRASRVSLMPSELEQAMSRRELADLIAFLRGERGRLAQQGEAEGARP